ncbi:MAG: hypothetical protein Q9174_004272 [Haloplaca sp. 1 TL-2023]
MQFLIVRALVFLEFASAISAAPLLRNSIEQPVHVRRRVPYSVVAVDGGSAATSTLPPASTTTVTLTVSATETVEQTTTLTVSPTCSLGTTSVSISTLTVTGTGPTTTVWSTISEDSAPSTPAVSLISTPTAISTIRADTTSEPWTASSPAVSTTLDVFSSTASSAAGISTVIQTSTVIAGYGIPPAPTTYNTGPSAAYSASRAWNTTMTTNYTPDSVSHTIIRASSDAWNQMYRET